MFLFFVKPAKVFWLGLLGKESVVVMMMMMIMVMLMMMMTRCRFE